MAEVARTWDAGVGNYINSSLDTILPAPNQTTANCSAYAWVKFPSSPSVSCSILGGNNGTNRIHFLISAPGSAAKIGLYLTDGVLTQMAANLGNLSGQTWFFAATHTSTGVADHTYRFYAGQATDDIVEVESLVAAPTNSVVGSISPRFVIIGGDNNNGIISTCKETIDQVGFINKTLTLAELKVCSACGNTSQAADARFIYLITGASPEGDSGALGLTGTIVGTVPTAAGICDSAAVLVPPGNPPLVSPNLPHISGGPGGGLGIPTLSFDDGGPAQLAPTVGNSRMVQTPDWGGMGLKGSRGGRKGGMLSQRASGMYRGLDHLASKLRSRK